MKKYVIKPKDVTISFTDWWDSLRPDESVSLREQIYHKKIYL